MRSILCWAVVCLQFVVFCSVATATRYKGWTENTQISLSVNPSSVPGGTTTTVTWTLTAGGGNGAIVANQGTYTITGVKIDAAGNTIGTVASPSFTLADNGTQNVTTSEPNGQGGLLPGPGKYKYTVSWCRRVEGTTFENVASTCYIVVTGTYTLTIVPTSGTNICGDTVDSRAFKVLVEEYVNGAWQGKQGVSVTCSSGTNNLSTSPPTANTTDVSGYTGPGSVRSAYAIDNGTDETGTLQATATVNGEYLSDTQNFTLGHLVITVTFAKPKLYLGTSVTTNKSTDTTIKVTGAGRNASGTVAISASGGGSILSSGTLVNGECVKTLTATSGNVNCTVTVTMGNASDDAVEPIYVPDIMNFDTNLPKSDNPIYPTVSGSIKGKITGVTAQGIPDAPMVYAISGAGGAENTPNPSTNLFTDEGGGFQWTGSTARPTATNGQSYGTITATGGTQAEGQVSKNGPLVYQREHAYTVSWSWDDTQDKYSATVGDWQGSWGATVVKTESGWSAYGTWQFAEW